MPSIDKLSVINSALIRNGSEPVNVNDDTSAAWIVGSQAFDDALPVVMGLRSWNFETAIAPLTPVSGAFTPAFTNEFTTNTQAPLFPGYTDIFALPADCLYLMNVWRTDVAALVQPVITFGMGFDGEARAPRLDYRIIGNMIQTSAPNGATALYMRQPFTGDQSTYAPLFGECLKLATASGVAIGLMEDMAKGKAFLKMMYDMVDQAATRQAQQEPRRAFFRSRMLRARRGGRNGWWG